MKLIKFSIISGIIALSSGTATFAAQPGYFAGISLGYAKTHSEGGSYQGVPSTAGTNTSFGYGINGGYNFNNYVGIEAAANRDAPADYSGTEAYSTFSMKLYDVHLLADGYYPVGNNFDLVGKAGLAYVKQSYSNSGSYDFYRPKLAAGIMYTATENVSVSATYSRIFGQGNYSSVKYLPNLDMAAVSVNYLF